MTRSTPALLLLSICAPACAQPRTSAQDEATLRVKRYVAHELDALVDAATALQVAAPAPDSDGWNAQADAEVVATMRARWADARVSYERIEGAIAVLFPELDVSTDERYDGFLATGPDDDLFDGEGVTGVHGIERILWADQQPESVVTFESALPGYRPAAFPADAVQAQKFRDQLLGRLMDDTHEMAEAFEPLALDPAAAYGGVLGSMAEQVEKVSLAATGEDESRYAQHTLADMRANLAGGRAIYDAFTDWLRDEDGGAEIDTAIEAKLDAIGDAYDRLPGDAVPAVPSGWNADEPSAEQLATPYGELWSLLSDEADPAHAGSLVERMVAGGDAMGIPVTP